jgi:hypothetical protein
VQLIRLDVEVDRREAHRLRDGLLVGAGAADEGDQPGVISRPRPGVLARQCLHRDARRAKRPDRRGHLVVEASLGEQVEGVEALLAGERRRGVGAPCQYQSQTASAPTGAAEAGVANSNNEAAREPAIRVRGNVRVVR